MNSLDKAGNYHGTGIGIVSVLLGRRVSDGKPGGIVSVLFERLVLDVNQGFQGEARAPGQTSIVQEKE